jgi:hypothetical protein
MPYFHNKDVNLLFIHIPKTGGSSLETYFSKKFNMPLNDSTLFSDANRFKGVSFQHQTYQSLITYPQIFKIDYTNLNILTVVRCPYHRLISDLFHFKYITANSSQAYVFKILATKYLNTFGANDNHKKPQYLFLLDKDGKMLEENITILRMEKLNADMAKLGYTDFNVVVNKNSSNFKRNYMSYLNADSIKLINTVYRQDFELFGYPMIQFKDISTKDLLKETELF